MLCVTLIALLAWAEPPPPRLSAGYRPAAEASTGPQLVRDADGSYRHRDPNAGFAATIHADGTVTFREIVRVKMDAPTVLGRDIRLRKKADATEQFNAVPNTQVHRGAHADSKHDLAVDLGPYGAAPILVGIGGRFGGIADLLVKGKTAKARRDFLEHTATLRTRLRAESQRAREREALGDLGEQLGSIWNDTSIDLATRRRRIFEMWDECVEAPSVASPEDAARAEAGRKARRVIEAFVRRVAPTPARNGFAPRELARLNASRQSIARFEPYR